jgi:hypothetical protein
LQEERNVIIVSAAKELDIKTKMLADAVKTRDEKVIEVEKLRACVQGLDLICFLYVVFGLMLFFRTFEFLLYFCRVVQAVYNYS